MDYLYLFFLNIIVLYLITCNYCKDHNHAIEECPILLAKIQEKQQNQNVQFIGEQRTTNPMVNVVTRSGAITVGQPVKPSGAWVRKAKDRKPAVDIDEIKETFVHASKEFCITYPLGRKGKEPQVPDRSMELCSDWKASTSATAFQEAEPTSNI